MRSLIALLAAVSLLALAGCGAESEAAPDSESAVARRAAAMFDGLQQDGPTLGDPAAPVTLSVYAAVDQIGAGLVGVELPRIVDRLVKPGRVKLRLRTVIGSRGADGRAGALRLARITQAVGLQDRLWNFYVAAATLSTGSADDRLLQRAFVATNGVNVERAISDARSGRIRAAIGRARRFAVAAGVDDVPAFQVTVDATGRSALVPWRCSGCLAGAVERRIEDLERAR